MVNATLILIIVLIVVIWLFIEFKRFRHKMLAVFLIVLILFTYFSFSSVVKEKNLDLKSIDGMKEAGKIYLLWLGNAFKNVKSVTANAINMSWNVAEFSVNKTASLNNSKV